MAESDGRVEYEVRADLSKIDSDMDAANKQITKSAEKVAKQQEQITEKSQQNIKKTVEKANDSLEQDNEKTQKNITQTVEKQSDKIVKTEEKNKKSITETAKTEGEKVVKNHKKATDKIVNQTENATEEIEKKTTGLGSKITAGLSTAGKGLAAGVGAGLAAAATTVAATVGTAVSAANDLDKATNQLTASLGLTTEEAEKYEETIKSIYGNNYGESFEDIANNLSLIKQQMHGITDDELQKVTESAYLMADVYDMDIAEGIRGANALVKQFGISAEEAYNLMAQGAEKGLNQNGDLADQLAEYSTFYADMGFSAEEAMSMLVSGAQNGAYQIDFLNDAFKEFSIRAKDGSQTTADGLALLGLDAEKVTEEFAAGGDRAYQAFKLVNEQLAACDDDVARNAAGVALYGTKWEDLGQDAVLAMAKMGDSIDLTRDKLSEMEDVKYSSLSDMFEGLKRTLELLLIPLGEELIPLLKDIIEVAKPIIEELLPQITDEIKPIISDLSGLITPLVSLISSILPQFVQLFKAIIPSVTKLIEHLVPTLTKLIDKLLPPLIKIAERILPPIIDLIDELLPIIDIVLDLLSPILDLVVALLEPLGELIGSVGDLIGSLLSLIKDILEPIMPIIQAVADVLGAVLGVAIQNVAELVGGLADVFSGLIKFLSGDIMGGLQQFGQGFVDLFSGVLGTIDSMFGTSLQKWYDETREACEKIGQEMYAATHQEEIRMNELGAKYDTLQSDMNDYIIKELRSGKSAEEAFNSAKEKYLTGDEQKEYFEGALADTLNMDTVNEWYKNIRDNKGLYSQGYVDQDKSGSGWNPAEWYSVENQRKINGIDNNGYKSAGTSYSYDKSNVTTPTLNYTPSTYSVGDFAYTAPTTGTSGTSGTAQSSATTSNDNTKSATTSGSSAASAAANKSQTISITSYIPTVWDDVATSNKKLAAGIGASRIGNSKSGKIISGLSAATSVSSGEAEKADVTLNDVVAEIKKLKTAQEKMQYTLDVTLKTNEYTLAKATVKGIKAIKKQTGKSPI